MEKNIAENNSKDNKRSHSKISHMSSSTEAWADHELTTSEAEVPIPSLDAIDDAKDWVDNGSKL